jgi:hypothetical protein
MVIFGAKIYASGEEEPQGDRELVGANESAADSLRSDLANTVENDGSVIFRLRFIDSFDIMPPNYLLHNDCR